MVLSSRSKCEDEVNIFDEDALQRVTSGKVNEKTVKFVLEKMASQSFVANNSYLLSYVHVLRLFDKVITDNDEVDKNYWLHLKEFFDFRSGVVLNSFLKHVTVRIRSATQARSDAAFIVFTNRYLKLATCISDAEASDLLIVRDQNHFLFEFDRTTLLLPGSMEHGHAAALAVSIANGDQGAVIARFQPATRLPDI